MAYIDKDSAIRTAIDMCVKVVGHGITQIDAVDIADAFENIPTADVVEVKRAHWREGRFLKVGDSAKGYPSVICSDCGITFCDIINNHNYMYRYCPNCGAKMRGDTE